jgi:hypothetical protein
VLLKCDEYNKVSYCHERIRTIAPVIEVNSIEELSEAVKQLYILVPKHS